MSESTARSRKKSKDTLKQIKSNPKSVGHRESNPKRGIHNITGLSQNQNKQTNKKTKKKLK